MSIHYHKVSIFYNFYDIYKINELIYMIVNYKVPKLFIQLRHTFNIEKFPLLNSIYKLFVNMDFVLIIIV